MSTDSDYVFRIVVGGAVDVGLEHARRAYEDGDLNALIWCVRACGDNGLPLPTWAGDAASKLIISYLSGEKISKGGRHANWITKYREASRDEVRHEAVEWARDFGVAEVDKFEAASELLKGSKFEGAPSTIEKAWKRHRKRLSDRGNKRDWGAGLQLTMGYGFDPRRDKEKIRHHITQEESPRVAEWEARQQDFEQGLQEHLKWLGGDQPE